MDIGEALARGQLQTVTLAKAPEDCQHDRGARVFYRNGKQTCGDCGTLVRRDRNAE